MTAPVEHLVYHAATHSLIGAMNVQATSPCSGTWLLTVHRLPLSPDGTALAGPIECSAFDHGSAGAPIGLDPLSDGDLLLTLTDGFAASDDELLRVDPSTLAVTVFAAPSIDDLDGGVWSQGLQRAVVLDDKDNALRLYVEGGSGLGTILPADVPVGDGTTGWSSANKLADVEPFGPGCPGSASVFGQGLAGKGGKVPLLGAGTCPAIGAPLALYLSSGVGQGTGLVAFSLVSAPYPLLGGTGYLLPPLVLLSILPLDGTSGTAGDGWAALELPIPGDPVLSGVPIFAQGAVLDADAPAGVALTAGLELLFG